VKLVVRGLRGFDWDEGNWRKSELKHGIAAADAQEVLLNDPLCSVDPVHSEVEQRYVALGVTNDGARLFVSFTVRRSLVRIISARPMSRKERRSYEKAQTNK
jgi:uncharacterized DUF497 family protein